MEEKMEKKEIEIEIINKPEKENIEDNKNLDQKELSNKNEQNEKELNEAVDINNNKKESKKIPITKFSSLSPELFSISYISEYKCKCGLIPSPEKAFELICCGILFCEECLNKFLPQKEEECPFCKSQKLAYRKIKDSNKVFYKIYQNLVIKCPYKCDWKGMWSDLDTHLIECKNGIRYCKYKKIGCDFFDESNKVLEHEQINDKLHLEMAVKYIKLNNIINKKKNFKIGDTCRISVHPHIMIYMTTSSWFCDGKKLPNGCYSGKNFFNSNTPRFRCSACDFDLCDKCVVNYIIS